MFSGVTQSFSSTSPGLPTITNTDQVDVVRHATIVTKLSHKVCRGTNLLVIPHSFTA
jgi:hypothetical protein